MPAPDALEQTVAKRTDISVKIDVSVYRKVRTVAAWDGVTVAEWLSRVADNAADKRLADMAREVTKSHRRPPSES